MARVRQPKVYFFVSKAQYKQGILSVNSSFLGRYVSKVQLLFHHRSSKDCKSHLTQSAVTECGLFDEFVPQEISQATSSLYFSTRLLILETQESILLKFQESRIESQVLKIKMRVTVTLPLSGTVT